MSKPTGRAGRIPRYVLCVALLVACARSSPAREGDPPRDDLVIPPGQEELLANMLGRGAALPGECQFASGQVSGPVVIATYTCSGAQVVFELRHPSRAAAAPMQTEKFSVALQSGSPPAGLAEALLERIRSREDDFTWLSLAPPAEPPSVFPYVAVAALLGLAALGWMLRRRRSAAQRAR
jgi:MYXO-CTERM domain-containing protein